MAWDLAVCRCGHPHDEHDFDDDDDMQGWCWYGNEDAPVCDCFEFIPLGEIIVRLGAAPPTTAQPSRRRR